MKEPTPKFEPKVWSVAQCTCGPAFARHHFRGYCLRCGYACPPAPYSVKLSNTSGPVKS